MILLIYVCLCHAGGFSYNYDFTSQYLTDVTVVPNETLPNHSTINNILPPHSQEHVSCFASPWLKFAWKAFSYTVLSWLWVKCIWIYGCIYCHMYYLLCSLELWVGSYRPRRQHMVFIWLRFSLVEVCLGNFLLYSHKLTVGEIYLDLRMLLLPYVLFTMQFGAVGWFLPP